MVATPQGMLVEELERQATRLVALDFAQVADLVVPLRERLDDLPPVPAASAIPFVLVLHPRLAPPDACMALIEHSGRAGVVQMTPTEPAAFQPIDEVDVPDAPAYLAYGIDTGRETLNVTPDDALPLLPQAGRSPLTIQEGIAVLIHSPVSFARRTPSDSWVLAAATGASRRPGSARVGRGSAGAGQATRIPGSVPRRARAESSPERNRLKK